MKAIIQLSQELIAFSLLGDGLNISINGQPVEFELVTDSLEEPIKDIRIDDPVIITRVNSVIVWIDTSSLDIVEFNLLWEKLGGLSTRYSFNCIARDNNGWFKSNNRDIVSGTKISIEQALLLAS